VKTEYREDRDLMLALESASAADLSVLVQIITDSGEGRLSLDSDVGKTLEAATAAGSFSKHDRELIAAEIQKFGGNSLINVFRGGKGVPYREIVCDVADHFKAKYESSQDVVLIETAILAKTLEQWIGKIGEAERKKIFEEFGAHYTGFGPAAMASLVAAILAKPAAVYTLASIVVPTSLRYLTGRAIVSTVAMTPLVRSVAVVAGPIGIAITGVWTAFDLASPAYRVTVPCVLQVALMRQKRLAGA
jgi:uncharacterized protein YaaW (UPF0174 family)